MPSARTTILEIQKAYLRLLEDHFKSDRNDLAQSGLTVADYVRSRRLDPGIAIGEGRTMLDAKNESCLRDLTQFWTENAVLLRDALRDADVMSVCLWPETGNLELLSRLALYFDTVVVPDPFFTFYKNVGRPDAPPAARSALFEWSVQTLELEPAILAQTDRPLAVIVPQQFGVAADEIAPDIPLEQLAPIPARSGKYTLDLFRDVFKLDIVPKTRADVLDAVLKLPRSTLADRLRDTQSRYVFDAAIGISEYMRTGKALGFDDQFAARYKLGALNARDLVSLFALIMAQFRVLEAREATAAEFLAHNVVSVPFRDHLDWKYRDLSREFANLVNLKEADIVTLNFMNNMQWLGGIDLSSVVKLRNDGVLEEMRDYFRVSEHALLRATVEDFPRMAAELETQVVERIEAYEQEVQEYVSRKRSGLARSIGSFALSVGFGAASLAFPELAALSVGSAVYGLAVGSDSLLDVINQHLSGSRTVAGLKQRPISFLASVYAQRGAG